MVIEDVALVWAKTQRCDYVVKAVSKESRPRSPSHAELMMMMSFICSCRNKK
jgi:hypothetical protein